MENNLNRNPLNRTWHLETTLVGLAIIAFGLLYMLRNMGVVNDAAWRVIFSWPSLLIVVGLINFAGKHYGWGTVLVVVGLIFIQGRIEGFNMLGFFWPVVIILVGLAVIFSHTTLLRSLKRERVTSGSDDFIEDVAVFGGSERVIHTPSMRGGKVIAIFGGSKLDLTQSQLSEGDNVLEMVTIFGGSTLLVPSDWNVKMEVFNIFGGFADKRRNINVDYNKTLVIKGVAIFGGGELKSY